MTDVVSRRIPLAAAFAIFAAFACAVFWAVFIGQRFFWEDFFIQEYPIRDYAYYSVWVRRALPFWNPYTWNLAPFLSDAQTGFWYPGNLVQLLLGKVFAPNSYHLPELIPEVVTIAHLPLAALGLFYLLTREFKISPLAALVAGLTFGFGTRIVADQNHPMFVYQIGLLPWEAVLLMRSWRSWRYAVAFGLLFGTSYLAGQPQVFLILALFFFCFALAESIIRVRSNAGDSPLRPLLMLSLGALLSFGVASIQLLPTLELISRTTRAHLTYEAAAAYGLHAGGVLTFLVPRSFPESAGYEFSSSHMQPTYYFGLAMELCSVLAIVYFLKRRHSSSHAGRYAMFVTLFVSFAILFALGHATPVHWLFWRFVPVFDKIRGPSRMLWPAWFLLTLYAGVGLDLLLKYPKLLKKYALLFLSGSAAAVLGTLAIMTGLIDRLFFHTHIARNILISDNAAPLILSMLLLAVTVLARRRLLSAKLILIVFASITVLDLWYLDFTQHRNTQSRLALALHDSASSEVNRFLPELQAHQKIVWLHHDQALMKHENLGLILHLPIQNATDTSTLSALNPMRLREAMPPIPDTIRRMRVMGVVAIGQDAERFDTVPHALGYVELFHRWKIASAANYADTSLDMQSVVLLDQDPGIEPAISVRDDSVRLQRFAENRIDVISSSVSSGVLLINDLYDPSWRATIDGKPTPVMRAFSGLRAITLPAGRHTVQMEYQNAQFALGWKISLATMLLGSIMMLSGLFRKTSVSRKDELKSFATKFTDRD